MCAGFLQQKQQTLVEYLIEENRVLREKLGPKRLRFTMAERRRLAVKAKALGRKMLRKYATLAHPDTLLRWYRELIAQKYDGSTNRGPGRPRIAATLEALIVKIATGARTWGYRRICGVLKNLGFTIAPNTVKRVLIDHGIDPAPERGKHTRWSTFLKGHWESLAACDFFTVEVLSWRGLVRYWVFFVIELKTRRVEIAGITCTPSGQWMAQIARNLTDCEDGFLKGKTKIIMDRDPLYTKQVRRLFRDSGVKPVRLPAQSPNLNAYAERFIRSIRSECLSRFILFGERHLRHLCTSFLDHYHTERNHQGIGNVLINPPEKWGPGTIKKRERLGGTLQYYYREAA